MTTNVLCVFAARSADFFMAGDRSSGYFQSKCIQNGKFIFVHNVCWRARVSHEVNLLFRTLYSFNHIKLCHLFPTGRNAVPIREHEMQIRVPCRASPMHLLGFVFNEHLIGIYFIDSIYPANIIRLAFSYLSDIANVMNK